MKLPFDVIDLTHPLSADTPCWDMSCSFLKSNTLDYQDCTEEVKFRVQELNLPAGIGTHMDAPAHCIPGGKSIDQIPLEELISPCIVIDISAKAHETYCCSLNDIHAFEQKYGKIFKGAFVIIHTGWGQYWSQPSQYRNSLQFPSVSKEVALLLLERGIVGLGIDTLSPDTEKSGYPVHQALLSAGKYIIENIANSKSLPAVGSFILALPLLIMHGTESPMRLISFTTNHDCQASLGKK